MLSVSEALGHVLEAARPLLPKSVPLEESHGLCLAESVTCPGDVPAFDKSMMDGFAVRLADLQSGRAELRIIEEVAAGATPQREVEPGTATRIYTGAPLPPGADMVVRVEETMTVDAKDTVAIAAKQIRQGLNVLRRGSLMSAGLEVCPAGATIRPQTVALLAELGVAAPVVTPRPRVAVMATGNELVGVGEPMGPGQIRNSNEPMLAAQIERAGGIPVKLGIARDEPAELEDRIRNGLECDVLCLSGGVSMGRFDLVPGTLEKLGVLPRFHRVEMKPGKPLWFGVREGAGTRGPCYIFGLPGNPVSSMVCFELFVRPLMRSLLGVGNPAPQEWPCRLTVSFVSRSDRPTYFPSVVSRTPAGLELTPTRWIGSADLRSAAEANSLAVLPAGQVEYRIGDELPAILWDNDF